MKVLQRSLPAFLALMVLCLVGCTQQNLGTPPETAPTKNQAAQANADFGRSRTVRLRGVLRDQNGKRVTGVVGVLFAVYEQQQGGAPLWQEVQNVQVDNLGRFTALVGSTKSGGIFPDLFPPEKALWLGKQVLLPGEVEQPRMRLVSTPQGLMVQRVATSLIPADAGDQPPTAEAQRASGEPPVSQEEQSAPSNRRRGARRQIQRRPMP